MRVMEWDTGAMIFVPKCERCGCWIPTWFEDAGIDVCCDCGRYDVNEFTMEVTPWPAVVEPVEVPTGRWATLDLNDEPPF